MLPRKHEICRWDTNEDRVDEGRLRVKLARTEIMKNRFSAMAEEAAVLAYRTAHTTFVKQSQDFQVALARPSGEMFAFPMYTAVTSGGGEQSPG